jgi:protease I
MLHKKYISVIVILLISIIIFTGCSKEIKDKTTYNLSDYKGNSISGENMKKIAMIISPKGYQDTEFGVPYKYFKDHGATVDVYSTKKGTALGSLGGTFNVEHTLNELNASNYNAIVFIGGPGTPIVRSDNNSVKIAKDTIASGKILGAICWSPTILAKAGVLKGKNATVWYGPDSELGMLTSEYLEEQGAKYTGQDATVDGNIITANGPAAAQKYAEEIWKKLIEKQTYNK